MFIRNQNIAIVYVMCDVMVNNQTAASNITTLCVQMSVAKFWTNIPENFLSQIRNTQQTLMKSQLILITFYTKRPNFHKFFILLFIHFFIVRFGSDQNSTAIQTTSMCQIKMRFNIFSTLTASIVIYQIWPKYIRITSVRDSHSKCISRVKEKCSEWKQQTRFSFYCAIVIFIVHATGKVLFIFFLRLFFNLFLNRFVWVISLFGLLENSYHRHMNWRSITDLHASKC